MSRFKISLGKKQQNTLPRQQPRVSHSDHHSSTVPRAASNPKQRPALSSMLGIGTEDIRRSLEALDQILDEFDDESGISQGSEDSLRRRQNSSLGGSKDSAENTARMIASQIVTGKAGLKKTYYGKNLEDDDLPPPPPELLTASARPVLLEPAPASPVSPGNKDNYTLHKRPPVIPKRSPETKLTKAEQLQAHDFIDGDDDELNTPESGYITPEQGSSESEYPITGGALLRPGQARHSSPRGNTAPSQHGPKDTMATNQYGSRVHADPMANNHYGTRVDTYGSRVQPEQQHVYSTKVQPQTVQQSSNAIYESKISDSRYSPGGALSPQVNPLLRASQLSSGSSTCTLVEQDQYEQYFPGRHATTLPRAPPEEGVYDLGRKDMYTRTLPTHNQSYVQNRPLPQTPVRSISEPHASAFPPPPPQFADHPTPVRSHSHSPGSNTESPTRHSLPFPVKLRPIGSPHLSRAADNRSPLCSPTHNKAAVPPPPPTKPKTSPSHIPPAPVPPPPPPAPGLPPPPPQLYTQNEYAEVGVDDLPPPPPPEGMTEDLANRVRAWTLNNEERDPRPSPTPDAHTALISQIQTGIKLRKSPFGTRLAQDITATREGDLSPASSSYGSDPSYAYLDSIESASVYSASSSSSGCHSNSSISNTSTGSPPPLQLQQQLHQLPQTPPRPARSEDTNTMQNNQSNEDIDITKLPGYQPVNSDLPAWKVSMIEKKNRDLVNKARADIANARDEEDKWRDIPEWKRSLIKEKEKRKIEEAAPLEAERRRREEEMAKLQAMPDWKRDLILKKRDL